MGLYFYSLILNSTRILRVGEWLSAPLVDGCFLMMQVCLFVISFQRISLERLNFCCDKNQEPELVRWTLVRNRGDKKTIDNFRCFVTVGYASQASDDVALQFLTLPSREQTLQVKSPEVCTFLHEN
jgi:hypothetical protein